MIFVDASAIVAILGNEPERHGFLRIVQQNDCITSPVALFEAALGLSRKTSGTIDQTLHDLAEFIAEAGIREVAVEPEDFVLALDAARRFGKGQGHPARLNLGDCFAYAGTVRAKAKLLYKGDDFSRTDIASAGP